MPKIVAWSVRTGAGDCQATLAALAEHTDKPLQPGRLPGPLLPLLLELGREALSRAGGVAPDLVLVATTKGDLPLWVESLLSESASQVGGPAWLAQQTREAFGCAGWTVSAACASGPIALAEAARCLRAGSHHRVLILGGDRLAPFVTEGFAGLRAVDPHSCRPFSADRQGTVLGETASAIVLTAEEDGLLLQGWGQTLDAHHMTGPCRDGAGLIQACTAALDLGAVEQPAAIIAHGTATKANDEAEAAAYATRCPGVPVTAWKGRLGHSLGACGLTEVALAAAAWHAGRRLPGVPGNPSDGTVAPISVLPAGWHELPGPWLSTNAGFGGINGAVLLGDRPARPRAIRPSVCSAHTTLATAADGRLPRLTSRQVFAVVDPSWGRMDTASRVLVGLGKELGPWTSDSAIILVSEHGCRESDLAFEQGRRQGQPDWQTFAYTLPSAPIGEAAIRLGIHGPGMAMIGASDSEARAAAQRCIAEGCSAVLLARIETAAPGTHDVAWAERWTLS